MSDVSAAEGFDAEFDAARDAEEDEAGIAAENEGEGEAEPAKKEPLPYETLQRRLADQQKATRAERRSRQELERRLEVLERVKPATETTQQDATRARRLAEGMPDPNEDPIGALEHARKVLLSLDADTEAEERQTNQQRQQTEQMDRLSRTMRDFEADFTEDHPDYAQAATYLMKARSDELATSGLAGQALEQEIRRDFANLASRALAAGKDPAEIVYTLAKNRGFAGDLNVKVVDAADKKLDQIGRGQQQARALPTGNSGDNALTYKSVGDLKGADFDKAFDKLRAQERRR